MFLSLNSKLPSLTPNHYYHTIPLGGWVVVVVESGAWHKSTTVIDFVGSIVETAR